MRQRIEQFNDIHVHAAALNAWNQTYTQISAGPMRSSLQQVDMGRFRLFREHINQRVVQHGQAPRDFVCFALPIAVPGTAHVQGREVDDKSVFFLRGGEEFMFHMPMNMDLLSITFEKACFEECLDSLPAADKVRGLLRQPLIKVPPARLLACRQRLVELFGAALRAPAPEQDAVWLETQLLQTLLQMLTAPECDGAQRQAGSTHSYIVEKLHRLTVGDAMNVPSILEASQRLQVSRRTVQNSFRTVAETTPLNYLRCVRLNGVRRELMSTHAAKASIGDVASRWGFFHLSHFAEDYQSLFGELPSHTPRAMLSRELH